MKQNIILLFLLYVANKNSNSFHLNKNRIHYQIYYETFQIIELIE